MSFAAEDYLRHLYMMRKILLASSLFLFTPFYGEKTSREVFEHIWLTRLWGEDNSSGPGSLPENAKSYMEFLQNFLREHHIKSVLDIGCGDWSFSKYLDWDGIDYIGVDVVKGLIAQNNQEFGASNIKFLYADFLEDSDALPEADLLLCKDVLQHLTNQDIQKFLKQLPKYKHCLITNDIDPATKTSFNSDISRGGYHYIDLTQPPFLLLGEKVLTYQAQYWLKQVLYVQPN